MNRRGAARRAAIHLAVFLAFTAPIAAWGGQALSAVPSLKAEGGDVESFLTPSGPAGKGSPLAKITDNSGTLSASPVPQNNDGFKLPGSNGQVPWSIIALLTTLTLIPSILLCMTPFARLLIVFHFLRQALGLQTTPSNQTLIGLSLILTFFLMQPVATNIYQVAIVPMQAGQITAMEAVTQSEGPIRQFMAHYVREKDVALFIELAHEPQPASVNDVSMRVMLPAYILSELKAGFQIGTVLFLPFLIVDMVVASITTSVGMLQLPPVVISTPLKLLLFLMVDGWHLLIGSLMRSFY
jgi:flagellar biosynthetic protein FliP